MSSSLRSRRPNGGRNLRAELREILVGQPDALEAIVPYIQTYQAGLAPEGRPAGVFLLLGPTGTGKTKTVEALAEVLHANDKRMLKIDCAEFQMEHEVAKLIGAPPGYLGHKETQPLLTQARLNSATSEHSSLAIVLFDEVEKAASSLTRLLLGLLDKAVLRLGDNTTVNFERTLIFLTSNLGAREMAEALRPSWGFQAHAVREHQEQNSGKLQSIGMAAIRRNFSPEFVNRLDRIISYQPLTAEALDLILERQVDEFNALVINRLGPRGFVTTLDTSVRQLLLQEGASEEYGARELKRVLQRRLFQPLGTMVAEGHIPPASSVRVTLHPETGQLRFRIATRRRPPLP